MYLSSISELESFDQFTRGVEEEVVMREGAAARVIWMVAEIGRWSEVFKGHSSKTLAEVKASKKREWHRIWSMVDSLL